MNPDAAEIQPAGGWGWRKFALAILLVMAAQTAFVFLFGAKKMPAPRPVKGVPEIVFAGDAGGLAALTDPTLFALPHAEDFPAGQLPGPPAVAGSEFGWTEPPQFLENGGQGLGATFKALMETGRVRPAAPDFKPAPRLSTLEKIPAPAVPQKSSWKLAGGLAGRPLPGGLAVPSPAADDVPAPSRVQLLVAPDGSVVSAVLLEPGGLDAADQQALTLARALQFAPAKNLALGEIIFTWHTVPAAAP